MIVLVRQKSATTNYFVHGKGNISHSSIGSKYFIEKF